MKVVCPVCYGPHPKWECKHPAKGLVAQPEAVKKVNEALLSGPSKRPVGRPKTITDMKAYKRDKMREYRAAKKAATEGK